MCRTPRICRRLIHIRQPYHGALVNTVLRVVIKDPKGAGVQNPRARIRWVVQEVGLCWLVRNVWFFMPRLGAWWQAAAALLIRPGSVLGCHNLWEYPNKKEAHARHAGTPEGYFRLNDGPDAGGELVPLIVHEISVLV